MWIARSAGPSPQLGDLATMHSEQVHPKPPNDHCSPHALRDRAALDTADRRTAEPTDETPAFRTPVNDGYSGCGWLLISPFSGVNEVLSKETGAVHLTPARTAPLSAVVEACRRKLPAYSAAATVMIVKLTGRVGAA